jgi:kynurenine formamidase
MDRHGFREKRLTLYSHTGTHIDAPAHMLPGGKTLDQLGSRNTSVKLAGMNIIPRKGYVFQYSIWSVLPSRLRKRILF